ncbi:MAG: hypothetical protein IJW53_00200 [Clostridia bacterium]|nr:hypothetical protein [Clostridia bacterium]
MEPKNVIIFGDSYSTFAGCIPEGYATYYSGARETPPDIGSWDESWWAMVIKQTGWKLVRNDSWSGSTIGYTGYDGADYSRTSSFITRLERLKAEGFFEMSGVDTVLVFGGTNDSWCGAPLGGEMYEGWEREDLYRVLPAIGCFFTKLRETLPSARIYAICNTEIKSEIVEGIKNASERIGAESIVLEKIDKINGHPTALGMTEIKDQVLKALGV